MRVAAIVVLCAGCNALLDVHDFAATSDASGDDDDAAPTGPHIIPGGGITGGAIDGVMHIFVVDRANAPVAGATVRVDATTKVTDADGLVVVEDDNLLDGQTIVVTAPNTRTELWVGANGKSITIPIQPALVPVAPVATVMATVPVQAFPLANGGAHSWVAFGDFLKSNDPGDPSNTISQGTPPYCYVARSDTNPCTLPIQTRAGEIGIIAAVYDRDSKGTSTLNDDTYTTIGYAFHAVTTTGGVTTGVVLDAIPVTSLALIGVSFDPPPGTLTTVNGLIGLEVPNGVYQTFILAASPVPSLASMGATGYRLSLAATVTGSGSASYIVQRHLAAGQTFTARPWLDAPTITTMTRTSGQWAASPSTINTAVINSGTEGVLAVTVFDGSMEFAVPATLVYPSTALDVVVSAIDAPGVAVTDFTFPDLAERATGTSQARTTIP